MSEETWSSILARLTRGEDLRRSSARWAMEQIIAGQAAEAQIAGFLIGLEAKGATSDEIIGLRDAALANSVPIEIGPDAVDIVGTGGDPYGVLNISSVAAVIVSAAGIPVIKHGNRAASSASGASDLLAELGVDATATIPRILEVFGSHSVAYLHAATFHPGFKNAAATRAALGIPTVFNMLGPLCNPARPNATSIGVSLGRPLEVVAQVFQQRGATAFVFRDEFGVDKLTTAGGNLLFEISRGQIHQHEFDAHDLGLTPCAIQDLIGGTPQENAAVALAVLRGDDVISRDTILLNTAAALAVYRLSLDPNLSREPMVDRLRAELDVARATIASGAALQRLHEWGTALKG